MNNQAGSRSGPSDRWPIAVATKHFYWKPMAALYKALELFVYRDAGVSLPPPCLDLGCGDGRMMGMVRDIGLAPPDPIGLDYSRGELGEARTVGAHGTLIRADARALPFADASFASVLANAILQTMPSEPAPTLAEISRVLRPGGTLVVTVPTESFIDLLYMPRLLSRLSRQLAERYVDGINRRMPHYHYFDRETMNRQLESNGLEIVRNVSFLSHRLAGLWSVLVLQPFRVFGVLKLLPGPLRRPFAAAARAALSPTVIREVRELAENPERRHGVLLTIARRR